MHVALIANLAAGGRFDPAPAVRAMEARGATVGLGVPDGSVDGELRTTGLERVTLERRAFALVT